MSISSKATLLSTTQNAQVTQELAHRFGGPSDRPALRPDLIVRHLVQMGESQWVLKNPDTQKIFPYGDAEWGLISLFDGTRTRTEIRDAYNAVRPYDLIEMRMVLDFEENLQKLGLLAQSGNERSLALAARMRDARKLKAEEKEKSFNIFLMLFPIADPNEFLNKTVKYVRWLWSPEAVAVAMVLFTFTTAIFVRDFGKIWNETMELYSFIGKPLRFFLQFYFILTIISALHELGHAYALKIYGGDCHSIGFALFFFLPAYFTDTTDCFLFESKWHRLWVNLAGIYVEMFICTAATGIWVVTYPDTFIHDVAYMGMIYTGVSTIFFNINPMTPTDGYHSLADLIEIPELRPESFQYIGALIQKYIFRLPVDVPVLSKRKRRILLIYGPLSIVYTGTIMLAIYALINHIYGFFLGEFATPLAILTAIRMFRKRLRKFTDVLKMFYLDKKEYLMSPKIKRRLGVAGAVVLLALILPWPHETLEVPILLGPATTSRVTAPADATVQAVDVHEGDSVDRGRALARLASPEIENRVKELTARMNGYSGEASSSRAAASAADAAAFESRARAVGSALEVSQDVEKALLVRAPGSGTVLTHRPEDLVGSAVRGGSVLFTLGDTRTMRVEIPVTERLIQSIRVGEPVSLQFAALPFRTYRTTISAIAPAAEALPPTSRATEASVRPADRPERFVAVAFLDNRDGALASGMAASAKLVGRRVPYVVQWWQILYHWGRRIFW